MAHSRRAGFDPRADPPTGSGGPAGAHPPRQRVPRRRGREQADCAGAVGAAAGEGDGGAAEGAVGGGEGESGAQRGEDCGQSEERGVG